MSRLAMVFVSGLIAAGVVAALVLAGIVAMEQLDHEPRIDNPPLRLAPAPGNAGDVGVLPEIRAPDPRQGH